MSSLSLRKKVTTEILNRIHDGTIKKDEILTEAQICEDLKVSRTPAREALIELVANEVLIKVPRKGYALNEIDQEQKLNVYNILAVLDGLAAALSVPNMTNADIERMNEIIDLIDISIKYKNYANYCDLQEQFHMIYILKSGNPRLIRMIEETKAGIQRYTYFSDDTEKLFELCKEVNDEHRNIVQLFQNKETKKIEEYLKNIHWKTKYLDII